MVAHLFKIALDLRMPLYKRRGEGVKVTPLRRIFFILPLKGSVIKPERRIPILFIQPSVRL